MNALTVKQLMARLQYVPGERQVYLSDSQNGQVALLTVDIEDTYIGHGPIIVCLSPHEERS